MTTFWESKANPKTGAARQSWSKANPRSILKEIVESVRRKSRQTERDYEDTLLSIFRKRVYGNPEAIDTIVEYWFTVNYQRLKRTGESSESSKEERGEMIDKARSVVSAAVAREANVLLLGLTMPNGKKLKFCTGDEVVSFGTRMSVLGKRAGSKKIGLVFTEEEVRRIYDQTAGSGRGS